MKPKFFFFLKWPSYGMAAGIATSALAYAYVVKKGDTLSTIVAEQLGSPVYGARGNLKKLLGSNPGIQNPNLILAGQKINLPRKSPLAESSGQFRNPTAPGRAVASVEAPLSPPLDTTKTAAGTTPPESNSSLASLSSADAQIPIAALPLADDFVSHGVFTFAPEFLSVKINGGSGSSNALLTSTSDFGGGFVYSQVWSRSFQSDFFFSLNKLSMKQPDSGGTLDNSNLTLYSFGASGTWALTPRFSLGGGAGIFGRFYLKATSVSIVRLDPLSVPQISVFGCYDFFHQKPFTLGARLGAAVDLSQSTTAYNARMNPSYLGAFYVKHEASDKLQTEIGLKASSISENTSIADQSETDIGIYLKLAFPFGQAKK